MLNQPGFLGLLFVAGLEISIFKPMHLCARNSQIPEPVRIQYDNQNRPVHIAGPGARKIQLEYNQRGDIAAIINADGKQLFEYGPGGRLKSIQENIGVTRFTTTPSDQIQTIIYPTNDTLHYAYTEDGNLAMIHWKNQHFLKFHRDLLGHTVRLESPVGNFEIFYDYNQRKMQRTYPNGAIYYAEYNPDGRPILIQHVNPQRQVLAEFRYTYNAAGLLQLIRETGNPGQVQITYTYDAYGQLLQADYTDGRSYIYTYDHFGNRLKAVENSVLTTATYDARDQLVSLNTKPVQHDAAGNLTLSGDLGFQYNAQDAVINDDSFTYQYNALGWRVSETNAAGTTYFLHLVSDQVYLFAEKGKTGKYYLWIDGQCVGQFEDGGKVLFFLEDHLGSIRCTLDVAGNSVADAEYTPFGAPVRRLANVRFGFGGEEQDETGKIYLRARYYLPALGRFLSKDPVVPQLMDAMKQNRYSYAGNSPVNYRDRDGCYSDYPRNFVDYLNNRPYLQTMNQHKHYDKILIGGFGSNPQDYARYLKKNGGDFDLVITLGTGSFPGDLMHCLPDYFGVSSEYVRAIFDQYAGCTFGTVVAHSWGAMAFQTYITAYPHQIYTNEIIYLEPPRGYSNSYQSSISESHIRLGDFIPAIPEIRPNPQNNLVEFKWTFKWGAGVPQTHYHSSPLIFNAHSLDACLNLPEVRQQLNRDRNFEKSVPLLAASTLASSVPIHNQSPHVGGVYLDQVAKVMGEITSVEGVAFDPVGNRIILVGNSSQNLALPTIRLDDLAAAFRSVFQDYQTAPGVSIDPDSANPYADSMKVRFLGGMENSHFGYVLFEADRTMKSLSLGKDTITRLPVKVAVDGYFNMLDLSYSDLGGSYQQDLWSRFWLVPEQVLVQVSADRKTITFPDTRIRVKTETMRWENGKLTPAKDQKDEKAEYFAAHFTRFYDDYAKTYPIFNELKTLTNLVALAKWLKENGSQSDLNWLAKFDTTFLTPRKTPALTVADTRPISQAGNIQKLGISLFGGADLTVQNHYVQDDGKAADLSQTILPELTQQPGMVSTSFTTSAAENKVAIALPTSQMRAGGAQLLQATELRLLERIFCSFHNPVSEFGYSWVLNLPQLTCITPNPEKIEYVAFDSQKAVVRQYRLTTPFGLQDIFFEKYSFDAQYHLIAYLPTRQVGIRGLYPDDERGRYRLDYDDGVQLSFDATGKILRHQFNPGTYLEYSYAAPLPRLTQVQLIQNGAVIEKVTLTYDHIGRIQAAQLLNQSIEYRYDTAGNLGRVVAGTDDIEYIYDQRHLVTRIQQAGKLVFAGNYDILGRLTEQTVGSCKPNATRIQNRQGQTVITAGAGDSVNTRIYDIGGRLLAATDPDGNQYQANYDEFGVLKNVVYSNAVNDQSKIEFSPDLRFSKYTAPDGTVRALLFDEFGRLRQIQTEQHLLLSLDLLLNNEYTPTSAGWLETSESGATKIQRLFDQQQRLTESILESKSPLGGQFITHYEYDPNQHLKTEVTDGLLKLKRSYENGQLQQQIVGTDSFHLNYDPDGVLTGIFNHHQNYQFKFDANGGLSRLVQNSGDSQAIFEYHNQQLTARRTTLGLNDRFGYDSRGLLQKIERDTNEIWEIQNAKDQITGLRNGVLQFQYQFNARGRVVARIE